MINNAIVTIAIPFYNAEEYLAQAIDSVLWQTYENWQLILLDDGSTDDSLVLAEEYAKNDNRIKVYSDGENKNLGFRLNQITSLVKTEYLARMDADDIMHPEKIEKQFQVLLNHPEIDVLGTNAYSIDENNNVVGIRLENNNEEIITVNTFIHPTIMAKRQWFLLNPYDVNAVRIEDIELWMRSKDNSNFKCLTEPLFFYREFGGEYYKKYLKSLPSFWNLVKKYKFNKTYVKLLLKNYLGTIVYFIYNKIGKENSLILRRNQKIVKPKYFKEYL